MSKKQKTRQNINHQQSHNEQQKQKKQRKESDKFSLYAFLEVEKKASKQEIKKQYRKLVLQYHPDKNQDDPTARQKFQKLKEAYDILIDDQKRREYDETGQVGDEFNENAFQTAYQYFRKVYKKITKQDIQHFQQQYRNGAMEQEDLLNFYEEHEGDMTALLECIPLSRNQDIPRFIEFYQSKIRDKAIQKLKKFDKTKGKIRQLPNQQKQFQEQQQKGFGALVMAIKSKGQGRVDFLQSLELKYGVGKKQKAAKVQKQQKKQKKGSLHKQSKKK